MNLDINLLSSPSHTNHQVNNNDAIITPPTQNAIPPLPSLPDASTNQAVTSTNRFFASTHPAVANTSPILKKIPVFLIDRTRMIPDGHKAMNAILTQAISDTWTKSFAHGKMLRWLHATHCHIFNPDGMLNMFEKPTFSKFKKTVTEAKKVLEEFALHRHSFTPAADGESYPVHLKSIIKRWMKFKEGAEDLSGNQTQSQKNCRVQDNLIGCRIPVGNNPTAESCASTLSANKKRNLPTATRGTNLSGALVKNSSSRVEERKIN